MQLFNRISPRTLAFILSAVLLLGVLIFLASRSTSRFAQEFASYEDLAKTQVQAAYVPAAPDNDVRQKLNADLSLALQPTTKPQDRLRYAKDGLALIDEMNKEVDAIGAAGEKADTMVAQMQIDSLKDFASSGESRELIQLAKQRSAIIEDIRGLSYRANFQTQQIFQKLIAEQGVLSASYTRELNDNIPAVEAQFDHRASLYKQLQTLGNTIDGKAAAMHLKVL
jgi:hypothetical protein